MKRYFKGDSREISRLYGLKVLTNYKYIPINPRSFLNYHFPIFSFLETYQLRFLSSYSLRFVVLPKLSSWSGVDCDVFNDRALLSGCKKSSFCVFFAKMPCCLAVMELMFLTYQLSYLSSSVVLSYLVEVALLLVLFVIVEPHLVLMYLIGWFERYVAEVIR